MKTNDQRLAKTTFIAFLWIGLFTNGCGNGSPQQEIFDPNMAIDEQSQLTQFAGTELPDSWKAWFFTPVTAAACLISDQTVNGQQGKRILLEFEGRFAKEDFATGDCSDLTITSYLIGLMPGNLVIEGAFSIQEVDDGCDFIGSTEIDPLDSGVEALHVTLAFLQDNNKEEVAFDSWINIETTLSSNDHSSHDGRYFR